MLAEMSTPRRGAVPIYRMSVGVDCIFLKRRLAMPGMKCTAHRSTLLFLLPLLQVMAIGMVTPFNYKS